MRRLVTALAVFTIGGCVGAHDAIVPKAYTLNIIQRYGVQELGADSMELIPSARRAGGGVIGAFRGVVQSRDSTVYVLDRHFSKIVGFRPDGSVREVILGGAGEGPGEFRLPVHIGMTPIGELAVLDYELRRVSFFEPMQGYQSSIAIDVPAPLRFVPVTEGFWVTRAVSPDSDRPRAYAVDRSGEVIAVAPPVPEEDRPFGGMVNLTVNPQGQIILPSPRPGLWDVFDGTQAVRRGEELFPGLAPPRVTREGNNITIGSTEAWTSAVATFADGNVLVAYTQAELDEEGFPKSESVRISLELFTSTGSRLGSVRVPDGVQLYTWSLYVSPVTGRLFAAVSDPFPMVLEMELSELEDVAAA